MATLEQRHSGGSPAQKRSSLSRTSITLKLSDDSADRIAEALTCPICLEVAQLPVNIICFQGCGGTQSRGNTCLRSLVCQPCANQALELHRPPEERCVGGGAVGRGDGFVRCLICRETRAQAALLTPENAYMPNFNIMDVMDVMGMKGVCRACDKEFESQTSLQMHYLRKCPHAVVRCRFFGCTIYGTRPNVSSHETTCSVGRARCGQCLQYVDRSDLLLHMVSSCRNRVVSCVLCTHRARLPEMLQHLKSHQTHMLQSHQQPYGCRSTGVGSTAWGQVQPVAQAQVMALQPPFRHLSAPAAPPPVAFAAAPAVSAVHVAHELAAAVTSTRSQRHSPSSVSTSSPLVTFAPTAVVAASPHRSPAGSSVPLLGEAAAARLSHIGESAPEGSRTRSRARRSTAATAAAAAAIATAEQILAHHAAAANITLLDVPVPSSTSSWLQEHPRSRMLAAALGAAATAAAHAGPLVAADVAAADGHFDEPEHSFVLPSHQPGVVLPADTNAPSGRTSSDDVGSGGSGGAHGESSGAPDTSSDTVSSTSSISSTSSTCSVQLVDLQSSEVTANGTSAASSASSLGAAASSGAPYLDDGHLRRGTGSTGGTLYNTSVSARGSTAGGTLYDSSASARASAAAWLAVVGASVGTETVPLLSSALSSTSRRSHSLQRRSFSGESGQQQQQQAVRRISSWAAEEDDVLLSAEGFSGGGGGRESDASSVAHDAWPPSVDFTTRASWLGVAAVRPPSFNPPDHVLHSTFAINSSFAASNPSRTSTELPPALAANDDRTEAEGDTPPHVISFAGRRGEPPTQTHPGMRLSRNVSASLPPPTLLFVGDPPPQQPPPFLGDHPQPLQPVQPSLSTAAPRQEVLLPSFAADDYAMRFLAPLPSIASPRPVQQARRVFADGGRQPSRSPRGSSTAGRDEEATFVSAAAAAAATAAAAAGGGTSSADPAAFSQEQQATTFANPAVQLTFAGVHEALGTPSVPPSVPLSFPLSGPPSMYDSLPSVSAYASASTSVTSDVYCSGQYVRASIDSSTQGSMHRAGEAAVGGTSRSTERYGRVSVDAGGRTLLSSGSSSQTGARLARHSLDAAGGRHRTAPPAGCSTEVHGGCIAQPAGSSSTTFSDQGEAAADSRSSTTGHSVLRDDAVLYRSCSIYAAPPGPVHMPVTAAAAVRRGGLDGAAMAAGAMSDGSTSGQFHCRPASHGASEHHDVSRCTPGSPSVSSRGVDGDVYLAWFHGQTVATATDGCSLAEADVGRTARWHDGSSGGGAGGTLADCVLHMRHSPRRSVSDAQARLAAASGSRAAAARSSRGPSFNSEFGSVEGALGSNY